MADDTGPSLITIDLGGNNKGAVRVPADVMAYFGIAKPVAGQEEMVTRRRKAYQRANYKGGLTDTTPTTIGVKASSWKTPVRAAKGATGTNVRIPTELRTTNGNLRFTSLNFPGAASVGAISNWLATVTTVHKPTYFVHNGNKYAVLKAVGDVNPDESPDEVA